MDNSMLNRFYEDNVKMMRDETSRNVNFALPIVQDILKYVNARDKRFKIQPLNVGSYYSHLKVSRADEFDYSVILDTPNLVWTTGKPAFYGFNSNKEVVRTGTALPPAPVGMCLTQLSGGTIQKWDGERINEGTACLNIDEHIVPLKVKRHFKALVTEAVNRPQTKQYIDAKKLSESPAATLTIHHPSIAGKEISIDLAPLIEAKLPFKDEFGWPRYNAQWPSRQKIQEIHTEGIHEVAKNPFYWSLSFVKCEKILLDGIDANGTCRKKSQRIMKKLRELVFCPRGMKQELTSYHLKNLLFWECENHPYDYEWVQDKLSERVESMCQLLIRFIQRGNLPLYFHIKVNLFESKDKEVLNMVVNNIYKFMKSPTDYLN